MLFSSETVSLQHEAECFVLLPILEENVEVILAGNDLVDDTELSDVRSCWNSLQLKLSRLLHNLFRHLYLCC